MPGYLHYITVDLRLLDMTIGSQPRVPGSLTFMYTNSPTRCGYLDAFMFTIPRSSTDYTFFMGSPYLADEPPVQPLSEKPYADKLGQWIQKEWKDKTENEDEMIANYRKWLSEADEPGEGYRNSEGFFSVSIFDGRHWLIDPNGQPFFSVGPDCIGPGSSGPVAGIEMMFEELPSKDGNFAEAWSEDGKYYDFLKANLIRAFGDKWYESWIKLTAHRLKSWGFNTVANWADRGFAKKSGMPYLIEPWMPYTETLIFRDFPDVFSPEYEKNAAEHAKILDEYKNDRNLIGYFMRNEPHFAFGDYNITLYMLKSETDSFCKREFISDMKSKYDNDITRFNAVWEQNLASFDDITNPWSWDTVLPQEAEDISNEFNKKLIRRYIEIPAKAFRAVAPNHLNLGLRWAWVANDNLYAGSEFIDVFSLNCYAESLDPEKISEISEKAGGKPVIIGEFHTGALDAGLPTNGICSVSTQEERGFHYSYFVENGAVLPALVGAHYFQYNDQPLFGRSDGENCNVGLIDVCGKPHTDLIEKAKETHSRIIDIRTGRLKPTDRRPEIVPNEGYCS